MWESKQGYDGVPNIAKFGPTTPCFRMRGLLWLLENRVIQLSKGIVSGEDCASWCA